MGIVQEIYKRFIIGDIKNTEGEPDVEEWRRFLDSLPVPKDPIDEAYNKYRCRLRYVPGRKTRLLNFASFFVLGSLLPRMRGRKDRLPTAEASRLLLEVKPDVGTKDVLPPELPQQYGEMLEIPREFAKSGVVSEEAYELYREVSRRYPKEYYFRLWALRELSNHTSYIRKYNPSATAVYICERNVVGPIVYELYRRSGRKYISFMHGEYLLQLIQAYMHFSEFYVWDEMYVDMFRKDLNCGIDRYIVTRPLKITKKWHLEDIVPEYYCTYYFSGESTTSVKTLAGVFGEMKKNGRKCLVRPHPRYSHWDLIAECFDADMIENPAEVTLEQSLGRTRYAVGLHSTVLREAQIEGREAVIDDLSDPPQYENLYNRKFVVLRGEHKLLSEIL